MNPTMTEPIAYSEESPGDRPGEESGKNSRSDGDQSLRYRKLRSISFISIPMFLILTTWLGWREWDPPKLREASSDYRRGDYQAAFRKSSDYEKRRPWSQAAASLAGRSLARLGRIEEAEAYFEKAGLSEVEILHERAQRLVDSRLNEEAIEIYRRILIRSVDDVLALRKMAEAQIMLSRWNGALETTGRLQEIFGGELIGHTLAGVVYHNTDRPEEAIHEFQRVLTIDPSLAGMPLEPKSQLWIYLCQDLLSVGRASEARGYLTRAMADGESPYLFDLLGSAYLQVGELEDAEHAWLLSIQRDANRARPWLLLGNLELLRNHPERAIERLNRAVALAPTAREPAYGLSQAYERLGRREEAGRYRAIANRLSPQILKPSPGMGSARGE
ncbi:tetratricopeptide repeat protein [Tundrisphaera lichenicola]|uniref:tetratricopeptide repeat protein n=1 Tax=Tundrisphaera lichenicola TaxID=2029860 RepID=UPI003EBC8749